MATTRPTSRCWAIRRPTCLCERRRTPFVACRERRAANPDKFAAELRPGSAASQDRVLDAGNATRCHGALRTTAPNDAVPTCSPRTDRHLGAVEPGVSLDFRLGRRTAAVARAVSARSRWSHRSPRGRSSVPHGRRRIWLRLNLETAARIAATTSQRADDRRQHRTDARSSRDYFGCLAAIGCRSMWLWMLRSAVMGAVGPCERLSSETGDDHPVRCGLRARRRAMQAWARGLANEADCLS